LNQKQTFTLRPLALRLALAACTAAGAGSAVAAPTFSVLHVFDAPDDGFQPQSGVRMNGAGALFGTTEFGGSSGAGIVYTLQPPAAGQTTWTETIIHSFSGGLDGGYAGAPAQLDAKGNVVGSTLMGGAADNGLVYAFAPPAGAGDGWTESALYSFTAASPTDGVAPLGGLLSDRAGNRYGTATQGGTFNCGTVFKLAPPAAGSSAWTETTLYNFSCKDDGRRPQAALIADANGNLYSTTEEGGRFGQGVVFELSPPASSGGAWTETTLWAFSGGADGAASSTPLVLAADGSLLGTAYAGGTFGRGVVFALTPPAAAGGAWTQTVVHAFTGGIDGGEPRGGLLPDRQGGYYGTASQGGLLERGLVFHLAQAGTAAGGDWTETPLHVFRGDDGAGPVGELLMSQGALYGVTEGAGNGAGTVYRIAP
jgi:hypothetical protein